MSGICVKCGGRVELDPVVEEYFGNQGMLCEDCYQAQRAAKVFYSGHTYKIDSSIFVDAANSLGYRLQKFDGYTRFSHDPQKRHENYLKLLEIERLVSKENGLHASIWDCADEDAIKADDAEWCTRINATIIDADL